MLQSIRIANLALIEDVALEFSEGFSVLSGETGAGKSLIVGAVGLVTGRRARPEEVRAGADAAEVEALFDLSRCPSARERLEAWGMEPADELVMRRVLTPSGRSRAYINGRMATLAQMADLASLLVGISSQREYQRLLDPAFQLDVIDEAASLARPLAEMASLYHEMREAEDALNALWSRSQEDARHADYLAFQLKEIDGLAPKAGETAAIEEALSVLRHAGRIEELCRASEEALYSADRSAGELAASAARMVDEASRLDPRLEAIASQTSEAKILLVDAAEALRLYLASIHADPERRQALEDRLHLLRQTMRKHRVSSETELLDLAERVRAELYDLAHHEERIDALRERCDRAREAALEKARVLSRERRSFAALLGRRLGAHLKDLGMRKAKLRIEIATGRGLDEPESEARIGPKGLDRVSFMLAPNPGEPELPLRDIASGGELSRTMLALHCALAGRAAPPTSIFDEVDAGVGGAIAQAIGLKLKNLAQGRQTICITHLPQIAALADHHYAVRKSVRSGRTLTEVARLAGAARVDEVARMIGGAEITSRAKAAARELMAWQGDPP